jgi:Uma2 family endonuclease
MSTTDIECAPLESGDHLTRTEFHRRYCTRPDIKKAELVEGVVFVASPVQLSKHGKPHLILGAWLGSYMLRTPGVDGGDNSTVILDEENEFQPDLFLFHVGGAARENDEFYVEGAPELVVEITASSAAYDLHEKKDVYRRNGVREYIVWQLLENRFDWFRLVDGAYENAQPGPDGVIESVAFPGLRLNVPKLLEGDYAGALGE